MDNPVVLLLSLKISKKIVVTPSLNAHAVRIQATTLVSVPKDTMDKDLSGIVNVSINVLFCQNPIYKVQTFSQ